MNARCYEDDIATHIQDLTIIDNQGRLKIISACAQSWSYKHSPFMRGGELESLIICAASFRLIPDDPRKNRRAYALMYARSHAKAAF